MGCGEPQFVWLCVVVVVFLEHGKVANKNAAASVAAATQHRKSVAVLPFLDLTEGMHEEEFADGMTEELIDKLSKIPGLRVPAPTSVVLLQRKTNSRRRDREVPRSRVRARWKRAKIRRAAARRSAVGTRG